jgi:hypothetical protein
MKKNTEKKNPYRTLGFGKINAPCKSNASIKCDKTTVKGDLRVGKK